MAGRARHILVVEGDPSLRALYRDILEGEGYRVTLWAAPRDPATVAALAPDALLLETVIGHREVGWDFLARLKSDPATEPIPVLICTAARLDPPRREQLEAWGCGLLGKPFDIAELLAAVEACLAEANGEALTGR